MAFTNFRHHQLLTLDEPLSQLLDFLFVIFCLSFISNASFFISVFDKKEARRLSALSEPKKVRGETTQVPKVTILQLT